jgi:hypothetical protein
VRLDYLHLAGPSARSYIEHVELKTLKTAHSGRAVIKNDKKIEYTYLA